MHVVVLPIAIVKAALLIEELSFPIPHTVALEPLVPAPVFVLLYHVLFVIIRAS